MVSGEKARSRFLACFTASIKLPVHRADVRASSRCASTNTCAFTQPLTTSGPEAWLRRGNVASPTRPSPRFFGGNGRREEISCIFHENERQGVLLFYSARGFAGIRNQRRKLEANRSPAVVDSISEALRTLSPVYPLSPVDVIHSIGEQMSQKNGDNEARVRSSRDRSFRPRGFM